VVVETRVKDETRRWERDDTHEEKKAEKRRKERKGKERKGKTALLMQEKCARSMQKRRTK
jgi:hypothetical protein